MSESDRQISRSPRFPIVTLEQAIERAAQLYRNERKAWVPVTVVAKHWRYSAKASGLLQTIASLKNYGLLEDEGSTGARKVHLTELALRILLDTRPDSPERMEAIRTAALEPAVALKIKDLHPEHPPSEPTLQHDLIFSLGFNDDTARKSARIILENSEFAGLYRTSVGPSSGGSEDTLGEMYDRRVAAAPHNAIPPLGQQVQGGVGKIAGGIVPTPAGPTGSSTPMFTMTGPTGPQLFVTTSPNSEQVIGPDGPITIVFTSSPTQSSYEFLKDYADLRIKVLERASKTPSSEVTESKDSKEPT